MLASLDHSSIEKTLAFWAPVTLAILSVTSLALRYVTNPISCTMPAQFTMSLIQYGHDVCFDQTQISLQASNVTSWHTGISTYHQWVPCYLGMAAIVCLVPHALWRTFSGFLWLDLDGFARTLSLNQERDPAGRHVTLRDSALLLRAAFKGGNFVLTVATVIRKLLVVVVCLIQLVMITVVWRPQLGRAVEGETKLPSWGEKLPLPQHFLCEFKVAQMNQFYNYAVQCYLPISSVISKGFAFLFYLFLLLSLAALSDVIITLSRVCLPCLRDVTIRRYLTVSDLSRDPWLSADLPRFLESLGCDGRLLLAVTADCCGPLAASDLLQHLLRVFQPDGAAHGGPEPKLKAEPLAPLITSAEALDTTTDL